MLNKAFAFFILSLAFCAHAPVRAEPPDAGLKVLVLDATGKAPVGVKIAAATTLVTEVGQLEGFNAVSMRELAALAGVEAEKAAFGCDEASCLTEIAGALNADVVLIVSVGSLAETFLISVSAFSTSTGTVVSAVQVRSANEVGVPFAVVTGLNPLLSPMVGLNERATLATALKAREEAIRDRDAGAAGLKTAIREAAREAASAAVEETARDSGAAAGAEAAETLLAKALAERAEVRFGPQSGPKVFIAAPQFAGVDASLGGGLLNSMAAAAQAEGLSVITAEDIKDLLKRVSDLAVMDAAGADEKSFAKLGDAMGVRHLVSVTLARDQKDTVVQARLINAELAEVVNRREVRASRWGGSLQEAAKVAIRTVLAPIFSHLQGTVALTVTEEGASVLVDDEVIGVTPLLERIKLAGGTHIVTVRKDGFILYQETVKITRGTALQREVLLRPSADFVGAHKLANYSWLMLGSVTAVAAVPALVGGAASLAGWFYIGWVQIPAINESYAGRDLRTEIPDPNNPSLTIPNPVLDEYAKELQLWQTISIVVSGAGFAALAGAVTGGLLSAVAWVFLENPWRYDDLMESTSE